MDLTLSGLTWMSCLVYLDDVIVFGSTFDELVSRLAAVFDRLRKAKLKLGPNKCRLFERRVSFLGHIISSKGIEPQSSKIEAIKNWPRPVSVRTVRQFNGLYGSFVQNYSAIANPYTH